MPVPEQILDPEYATCPVPDYIESLKLLNDRASQTVNGLNHGPSILDLELVRFLLEPDIRKQPKLISVDNQGRRTHPLFIRWLERMILQYFQRSVSAPPTAREITVFLHWNLNRMGLGHDDLLQAHLDNAITILSDDNRRDIDVVAPAESEVTQ